MPDMVIGYKYKCEKANGLCSHVAFGQPGYTYAYKIFTQIYHYRFDECYKGKL